MIKKYKCDFCQSYFTKEQLDGQFVCPQCYQDIDPDNFKLFGSKNKNNDEQFEDDEESDIQCDEDDDYEDDQQYDDEQFEDDEEYDICYDEQEQDEQNY